MEHRWATGEGWLGELLTRRGMDRITADELMVPPGLDALFSLLELRRHHDEGHYQAIVVDCPSAAATMELLSAPDVARWWLERALPQRSGVARRGRRAPRRARCVTCTGWSAGSSR